MGAMRRPSGTCLAPVGRGRQGRQPPVAGAREGRRSTPRSGAAACAPRPPAYNGCREEDRVTAVIAISTLVCLAGLLGLAMAALAADPAARILGIGLFVLAWLAMLGYHGRRAERRARAG